MSNTSRHLQFFFKKPRPYDFGFWYADVAAVLTLVLVFSHTTPWILALGCAFSSYFKSGLGHSTLRTVVELPMDPR